MNNIKSTSAKEVIGRVLRMVRNLDSTYYADMIVWSYEALRGMETKWALIPKSQTVQINNHVGMLPCGYFRLIAVEYKGTRLPYGGDVTHMVNPTHIHANTNKQEVLPNEYISYRNADATFEWTHVTNLQGSTNDYYKTSFDCIHTSFKKGEIKLHYLTYGTDEEGYPLMADSEQVKRAMFYYILLMLSGAGHRFLNNQLNDFNYLMQLYNEANAKAIADMSSVTIDRMEKLKNSHNRLILNHKSWKQFNINSEYPESIDTHLDDLDYYGNK